MPIPVGIDPTPERSAVDKLMDMSIYSPFIGGVGKDAPTTPPSDKIATFPTALSATRPIIAAEVGRRLVTGEGMVTPLVLVMAATDMEGVPARAIDKHFPDSGRGTTEFGVMADKIADTAAILEVSLAALVAPKVSMLAKLAILTVLVQEGYKANWALKSARAYKRATVSGVNPQGEILDIPADLAGKAAMAEKLTAIVLGVATHDFEDEKIRKRLGVASLTFAVVGSVRGEATRRRYNARLANDLEDLR